MGCGGVWCTWNPSYWRRQEDSRTQEFKAGLGSSVNTWLKNSVWLGRSSPITEGEIKKLIHWKAYGMNQWPPSLFYKIDLRKTILSLKPQQYELVTAVNLIPPSITLDSKLRDCPHQICLWMFIWVIVFTDHWGGRAHSINMCTWTEKKKWEWGIEDISKLICKLVSLWFLLKILPWFLLLIDFSPESVSQINSFCS